MAFQLSYPCHVNELVKEMHTEIEQRLETARKWQETL